MEDMKGLEHLSGQKELLEKLDNLANRAKESLRHDPAINDEAATAKARDNMTRILVGATIKDFSGWLHTDPVAMSENPRFFYLVAEFYERRRKH